MSNLNPKVDEFITQAVQWQEELNELRRIILDCLLVEEIKWNVPIYTFQGKNIVGINGLKEYCALAFFKGVLLADENGILIQPGKNTQSGRWMKFRNVHEIIEMEQEIMAYIHEAVEVEKSGMKVKMKQTADFSVPDEFQKKLNEIPNLQAAFEALTPGRQRAYLYYFSQPKLSKTRTARVENFIPKILDGKGL